MPTIPDASLLCKRGNTQERAPWAIFVNGRFLSVARPLERFLLIPEEELALSQ